MAVFRLPHVGAGREALRVKGIEPYRLRIDRCLRTPTRFGHCNVQPRAPVPRCFQKRARHMRRSPKALEKSARSLPRSQRHGFPSSGRGQVSHGNLERHHVAAASAMQWRPSQSRHGLAATARRDLRAGAPPSCTPAVRGRRRGGGMAGVQQGDSRFVTGYSRSAQSAAYRHECRPTNLNPR